MGKQICPCFFIAKETNNCLKNSPIKQYHPQDKNENVVGVVCYTDELLKCVQEEVYGVTNKLKPDSISHCNMQIRT